MGQKTLQEVQEAAEQVVLRDPNRTNELCHYFALQVSGVIPSCIVAEVFSELGILGDLFDLVRHEPVANEANIRTLWVGKEMDTPMTFAAMEWLEGLQRRCDGTVIGDPRPTWKDAYVDQINGMPT